MDYPNDSYSRINMGNIMGQLLAFRACNFTKKCALLFAITVLCSAGLWSQSLSIYPVTFDAYQTHRMSFYAFNAQNQLITNLSTTDFTVTEATTPLLVQSISCPINTTQQAISVVLTLDVSGSMSSDSPSRMTALKNAVTTFISMLDLTKSECAITSFDHLSYLNQDFTQDRTLLTNALNTLAPRGGTNYNSAFFSAPGSAMRIASNGKYKRVIVLFTDGNAEGNRDSIINEARRNNITIYTIAYRMQAPGILSEISSGTGGQSFGYQQYESISNQASLTSVFRAILMNACGIEPCSVVWRGLENCSAGSWRYNYYGIPSRGIPSTAMWQYFWVPGNRTPYSWFGPLSLTFGLVPTNTTLDKTVQVYAYDEPIRIDSTAMTNSRFTVVNWGGTPPPFTIDSAQSRFITVRYSALDTNFNYGQLLLYGNICSYKFIGLSAGGQVQGVEPKTLRLNNPNGVQDYNDNSCWYTYLNWTGVAANDTVRFEWSSNNGTTWQQLYDNVTNRFEWWIPTPKTSSSQNRIRISHTKQQNNSLKAVKAGHTPKIRTISLNPNNSNIAVVTVEPDPAVRASRMAYILNLTTGDTISTLSVGTNRIVFSALWTANGSNIVTCSNNTTGGGQIAIWNATTYQQVRVINTSQIMTSMAVNPASTIIAVGVSLLTNNLALYNFSNGTLITNLNNHATPPTALSYNNDGTRLTSGDAIGKVTLWNTSNNTKINDVTYSSQVVTSAHINPTQSSQVIVSYLNGVAKLWDISSGTEVKSFDNLNIGILYTARFNNNGTRILLTGERSASSSALRGGCAIYDILTDNITATFDGTGRYNNHNYKAQSGVYTSDDTRIITANSNGGVTVWNNDGTFVRQVIAKGIKGVATSLAYYADDTRIASLGEDGNVIISDAITLDSITSFTGLNQQTTRTNTIKVSSNIQYMVAVGSDSIGTVWNVNTGAVLFNISQKFTGCTFHPNSQSLVTIYDNTLRFYALPAGTLQRTINVSNVIYLRDICFNNDGSIIYASGLVQTGFGGIVAVNSSNGSETDRWVENLLSTGENYKLTFSSGAKMLTMFSVLTNSSFVFDSTLTRIRVENNQLHDHSTNSGVAVGSVPSSNLLRVWRLSDGATLRTANPHSGFVVNHTSVAKNASRIASATNDGNIWLWDMLPAPVQMDTSALFGIGTPILTTPDTVYFGKMLVGSAKDTVITDIIRNTGTTWTNLDSAIAINTFQPEFQTVQTPRIQLWYPTNWRNPKSVSYELRFAPTYEGIKIGELRINTTCGLLKIPLKGEGVLPPTSTLIPVIDLGKVEIGTRKDSLVRGVFKNVSNSPLNITSSRIGIPDSIQFSIVSGGGSFTLQKDSLRDIQFRFAPTRVGRTSSTVTFTHPLLGSPVVVQLMAEGITVPRISALRSRLLLRSNMCTTPAPREDTISIRSSGTGALVIDSIKILNAIPLTSDSIYFSLVNPIIPDTIASGVNRVLRVRFLARSFGSKQALIAVWSNALDSTNSRTLLLIPVQGTRDTSSLQFGDNNFSLYNLPPNTVIDTSFSLVNTGTVPVSITTPSTLGKFIIQSCIPNPIPAGVNARISLRFMGGDTSQSYTENYSVSDSCKGITSIQLRAFIRSPKPFIIAPASLTMNTDFCSGERDTSIYITNSGLRQLEITNVTFSGSGASQFTMLSKPTSIANGVRDSIRLLYKPTSQNTSVTMGIASNADNALNGFTFIPINAERTKSDFALDSSKLLFLNLLPNTTADGILTIKNTGTAPVYFSLPITRGKFTAYSITPNPIQVGTTSQVRVRFTGDKGGSVHRDTIELKDSCGRIDKVYAEATVQSTSPILEVAGFISVQQFCSRNIDTAITLRNLGKDTLIIDSIRVSSTLGLCSILSSLPIKISGGSSARLLLRSQIPQGSSGLHTLNYYVSGGSQPDANTQLTYELKIPKLDSASRNIVFRSVRPQRADTQFVSLKNLGSVGLQLPALLVKGSFSLDTLSSRLINGGDSLRIRAVFAGSDVGKYYDTLRFIDTCGNEVEIRFTAIVEETSPSILGSLSPTVFSLRCDSVLKISQVLTNSGDEDLMIDSVSLSGNVQSLRLTSFTNKIIQRGGKDSLQLTVSRSGLTSDTLRFNVWIYSNASNNNDTTSNVRFGIPITVYNQRNDTRWDRDSLLFGIVTMQSNTSNYVWIKNRGNTRFVFTTPIRSQHFQVDSIASTTLLAGDSTRVRIVFNGADTAGTLTESLEFIDSCGIKQRLFTSASIRGIGHLSIDSAQVEIGKRFTLPIRIHNAHRLLQSGVNQIKATLSWNASTLALNGVQQAQVGTTTLQNNTRLAELTFFVEQPYSRDSIVALIDYTSALGNDTIAVPTLTDIVTIGGIANVSSSSGRVRITGHCEEGGTRLFAGFVELPSMLIQPNTASSTTQLKLNTPERAVTSIMVYNTVGQSLKILYQGIPTQSQWELPLSLEEIPSGVYFITLTTPTTVVTKRLEVVH
jgi:WD40 repeat protein